MVSNDVRYCDVCGEVIPDGAKYSVNVIPPEEADLLMLSIAQTPDLAPTYTREANGGIRIETCLGCEMGMTEVGDSLVQ